MTYVRDPKAAVEKVIISRSIWLYLLAEGGWHEPDALCDGLLLDKHQVLHSTSDMTKRGMLIKRAEHTYHPEFCVKPECRLPSGLTVQMISEALHGVKPPPHE